MTIRTLFTRLFSATTTQQRRANDAAHTAADTGTRRLEPADLAGRRDGWPPTARSAFGRHIQAVRYREAAAEAIRRRGHENGMASKDILAVIAQLDAGLYARHWHPDQFTYDHDEPWIDDFMTGVDVDYDPVMADYDRTAPFDPRTAGYDPKAQRQHWVDDGDEA